MVRAECCDRGSYLADGFCVSNKEDALWSSHAISFYADVATALGMMALVHLGSERGLSEAALTPIAKNSMSLLGHGVGHLFLGVRAAVSNGAIFEGLSTKGRLAMFAAFMPVWSVSRPPRPVRVVNVCGKVCLCAPRVCLCTNVARAHAPPRVT